VLSVLFAYRGCGPCSTQALPFLVFALFVFALSGTARLRRERRIR
jgi:hypothetical protein